MCNQSHESTACSMVRPNSASLLCRFTALFEASPIIDLLRTAAKDVNGALKKWDEIANIPTEAIEILQGFWRRVEKNDWFFTRDTPPGQRMYIFTDAAGKDGWGFVLADESGMLMSRHFPWRERELPMHIFIKETWATFWPLKFVRPSIKNTRSSYVDRQLCFASCHRARVFVESYCWRSY